MLWDPHWPVCWCFCRENRPQKGGICVANHTTPIDVVILANDGCYSMVSFASWEYQWVCDSFCNPTLSTGRTDSWRSAGDPSEVHGQVLPPCLVREVRDEGPKRSDQQVTTRFTWQQEALWQLVRKNSYKWTLFPMDWCDIKTKADNRCLNLSPAVALAWAPPTQTLSDDIVLNIQYYQECCLDSFRHIWEILLISLEQNTWATLPAGVGQRVRCCLWQTAAGQRWPHAAAHHQHVNDWM